MRTLFITTAITTVFASGAFAEDTAAQAGAMISGEFSINVAETAAGDWGGTTALELGVDAGGLADVDLDFVLDANDNVKLDTYGVGMSVAGIGLSFGNDQGVLPGAEGEQTLAAPAMGTAIGVQAAGAKVALGFTDFGADVTDISNVQGAYTIDMNRLQVTAGADYNFDTENTVLAAGVGGLDLGVAEMGSALTYDLDAEDIGYELTADTMGVTAYLNGDSDEMLQNVGAEYEYQVGGGAEITVGSSYNFNSEEFTPTAGVSFNF